MPLPTSFSMQYKADIADILYDAAQHIRHTHYDAYSIMVRFIENYSRTNTVAVPQETNKVEFD